MAELDEQEQALRDEEIKSIADNLGDEELEEFKEIFSFFDKYQIAERKLIFSKICLSFQG
jgi:DNA-binding protein H-NS